jgi:hypothetical protein
MVGNIVTVVDYLSCPNCGSPITGGELCNLTCRRELAEKQKAETRAAEHARMRSLVQGLCCIEPEPFALSFSSISIGMPATNE